MLGRPDRRDLAEAARADRADGTDGMDRTDEHGAVSGGTGATPGSGDGSGGDARPEPVGSEPSRNGSPTRGGERAAETGGVARSVEASPGADSSAPAAARRGRLIAVLLGVAAFAYVLDLVSKLIVVARLEGEEPIDLIGDWLQFRGTRNPGAAFGIGEAYTIVFTVIAATIIVVILRLSRKLYSLPWAIALGLLLGGALGNLTDRVFRSPGFLRGHVVDFIAPKHFAVFNLADSAIVIGGCLIVLLSFLGLQPDGTREGAEGDDGDEDDEGRAGGAGGVAHKAADGDGEDEGSGGTGRGRGSA